MTFEKLSKIMIDKLGTDKLSDIALEFKVSPQVVSNWKSRNQVPYKYIKILREKIDKKISYASPAVIGEGTFIKNEEDDDDDLVELLISYYKILSEKFIMLAVVLVFFFSSGFIYVNYLKVPLFLSKTKIIPISTQPQSGGVGAIAQRFGVSLVPPSESGSLSSAEIFPDILRSRSLMRELLYKEFTTNEFGENQKLIKIILNKKNHAKAWKEVHEKKAVSKLLNLLNVTKKRNSPIITLTAITKEPMLSAEILKAVTSELQKKVQNHKLKNVKETTSFIEKRIIDIGNQLVKDEEKLKNFRQKNRNISSSPALLLEEERLIREIGVSNSIFQSLKLEFEKSRIEESRLATVLEILDPPESPLKPINIRPIRVYLLSIFLGIIVSFSYIFGWNYYNNSLKNRLSG